MHSQGPTTNDHQRLEHGLGEISQSAHLLIFSSGGGRGRGGRRTVDTTASLQEGNLEPEASGGSRWVFRHLPPCLLFVGYYRRHAGDVIAFMVRIRIRIRNRHYSDDQRLDQFYHDTLHIGSAPACAYLLRVLLAPRPKRTEWPYEAGPKREERNQPPPPLSLSLSSRVSPLPSPPPLRCTKETKPWADEGCEGGWISNDGG